MIVIGLRGACQEWHKSCTHCDEGDSPCIQPDTTEDSTMKWEAPSYNDIRFGFEVTMYIYNR